MAKLNWTNKASNDLKNIFDYIATDSKFYAKRQLSKLVIRTQILKTFPKSGRIVPEFSNNEIRELIEGRYRIVYKILNDNEIDILTIHHTSRSDINLK